jgi:hypothetical protein
MSAPSSSSSSSSSAGSKETSNGDPAADFVLLKSSMSKMHALAKSSWSNKKPFKTKMWSNVIAVTATGGAALSGALNVQFANSVFPDFNSVAALFDMCRIVSGTLHWWPSVTATGANVNIDSAIGVEFDTAASAAGSIASIMIDTYHSELITLLGTTATPNPNHMPMRKVRFKLPYIVGGAASASEASAGSAWFVLNGTNTLFPIVVQYLITATGGSGASAIRFYVEFDCEFKIRT